MIFNRHYGFILLKNKATIVCISITLLFRNNQALVLLEECWILCNSMLLGLFSIHLHFFTTVGRGMPRT